MLGEAGERLFQALVVELHFELFVKAVLHLGVDAILRRARTVRLAVVHGAVPTASEGPLSFRSCGVGVRSSHNNVTMRDRQVQFSPFRNFATQAVHSVRLSSIDRRASGASAATPACVRSYAAKKPMPRWPLLWVGRGVGPSLSFPSQ